jgi:hypothetical protein
LPHPLQDAWVQFLQPVPFQYFTTLTFDKLRRLHPEAAHKKIRLYTRLANAEFFGRGYEAKHPGIGTLIALEPHKDERTHVHLLQYHPELTKQDVRTRMTLKNLWEAGSWAHHNSLREGIARCLPAADDAAKSYCAKNYATKGGDLYLDDALMHWMQQKPWQPQLLAGGAGSRTAMAGDRAHSGVR